MVRLVTVIGHGVNLLPHFINHYKSYVDEINIVCYNSDLHPNITDQVTKIISEFDSVKIVKEIYHQNFDWEMVTNMYNLIKLTQPNDWWIVSDIDEFHLYPDDDLSKIISDCEQNGWELVRGGFIDRIGEDGNFPAIRKGISLRVKKVADNNKEYSYSSEYLKMYEELKKTDFMINLNNPEYMIELSGCDGKYKEYKNWNKLIRKIISI